MTAVATLTVATVSPPAKNPQPKVTGTTDTRSCKKNYIQLPLGTIRAEGWMHDQLTRMRDGMTGHLE